MVRGTPGLRPHTDQPAEKGRVDLVSAWCDPAVGWTASCDQAVGSAASCCDLAVGSTASCCDLAVGLADGCVCDPVDDSAGGASRKLSRYSWESAL